jgi:hypothetical protein
MAAERRGSVTNSKRKGSDAEREIVSILKHEGYGDIKKGERYNHLLAVDYVGRSKSNKPIWTFLCDCGATKEIIVNSVKTGNTKSCGCIKNANQYGKNNPSWKGGKSKGNCLNCNKEFYYYPSRRMQQYCSLKCFVLDKYPMAGKKKNKCPACGVIFETYINPLRERIHCSDKCSRVSQSKAQWGESSHFWKGGKTIGVRRLRNHPLYDEWRKYIFERDNYTCQHCGNIGGRLVAHHIVKVSENPRKALRKSNGIALCWDCHQNIHWPERVVKNG